MTIKDMHYDFKKKLNKVDSQKHKNILIPEIDWTLNEALGIFVKTVSNPRIQMFRGFEINQRSVDDIKPLVIPNEWLNINDNIVTLPDNYWFFVKGKVEISKKDCGKVIASFTPRQQDDDFKDSVFDNSSFKWRNVNGIFYENKIELFTDGSFTNNRFKLSYIKLHPYIHNAEDFRNGTYKLPSGEVLENSVNCIFRDDICREIVDIAVLLISGEISSKDYQLKQAKLNLNQLQ